jgi:hypothetical protein
MVFQQLLETPYHIKIEGCEFEPWTLVSTQPGNNKGGSITVPLLFDWFGISCMTSDNFLFLFAKQGNPNQSKRRSTVQ